VLLVLEHLVQYLADALVLGERGRHHQLIEHDVGASRGAFARSDQHWLRVGGARHGHGQCQAEQ
jgi:hypothetical protein